MKCNRIQELAADYLGGGLPAEERENFQRHLGECDACRTEIAEMAELWGKMDAALDEQPSPELERKFNSMLKGYLAEHRPVAHHHTLPDRGRVFHLTGKPFFQAAAAIALFILGMLYGRGMEHGKLKDMEVATLRQEMSQMREMVTISLLSQSSAIDRLQGVSMSREVGAPEPRLVEALIKTLDTDPDVNVRMAAVEALGRYRDRTQVRDALVDALGRQDSPLVQVSLIELLVQMRAPGTKDALQSIINSDDSMEPVKERARAGLDKLI